VLCVCTANVCRSPAAELLIRAGLRRRLGERAARAIQVSSAGIWASNGRPVEPGTAKALRGYGVTESELAAAISTPLRREEVVAADLVLGAAAEHVRGVWRLQIAARYRTFTLGELAWLAEMVDPADLPLLDPGDPGDLGHRAGRADPPDPADPDQFDPPVLPGTAALVAPAVPDPPTRFRRPSRFDRPAGPDQPPRQGPADPRRADTRPAGLDPAGPDPAGPDPAGPDPAGPDPAGPDPAGLDPAGLDPASLSAAELGLAGAGLAARLRALVRAASAVREARRAPDAPFVTDAYDLIDPTDNDIAQRDMVEQTAFHVDALLDLLAGPAPARRPARDRVHWPAWAVQWSRSRTRRGASR
jgi:protein-tyrosine-phosphatase